jgi:hypothetical protein
MNLLDKHKVDAALDLELAKTYILEVEDFLKTTEEVFGKDPKELKYPQDSVSPEIKALVTQVTFLDKN